ncbi:MAG: HipA domain-containing protein [Bifidobacteriaceae bacterium]|jgi:serine/threonine-protein kinase HipA|nr:HipA domain-containing protein [Bifidobacteriaceae bacterium]
MASKIRRLRSDSTARMSGERDERWSLGGFQGKFAVRHDADESWTLPTGPMASSHIVKTGVARRAGSDVAEYVTMRTAAALGLPTAPVDLVQFDDQVVLVVTRFDRLPDDAGRLRRIHQTAIG